MRLLILFLFLPLSAAAEAFPSCVTKTSSGTYREPASLQALLDCQKKKLGRFASAYEELNGKAPGPEVEERWQERQRGEVRDFLARHPKLATVERKGVGAAKAKAADPAGETSAPQAQDAGTDALRKSLWEKSDDGRKGVTPEMAKEIVDYLTQQQGSVSPDMAALLEAVQKDGPELTDGTMRKLQDAARKAKDSGLDLETKPEIEQLLLNKESLPPTSPGVN